MKKILKIVFVIIGTLIGAGFASGQEIYSFFYVYGKKGIIGLILSALIMSVVIYKVLKIIKDEKIRNYKELLEVIISKKSKRKNFNLKSITNNIINMFVLITFFIMIAGFGAYFEEQLKINHIIGSSILATICFFVFTKNVQGVVKVNEIIIPFLIGSILLIGGITFKETLINIKQIEAEKNGWVISSFLYAGYNTILLIPVLITLRNYLKDKKQIKKIAIITCLIIIVLGTVILLTLTNVGKEIKQIEMPIAYVVSKMSKIIQIVYGAIIVLSIFTTSVSLGNSFLSNFSKNRTIIAIIICIAGVLSSNLGFSNLINSAYPIFGILGTIQIFLCLYKK